MKMRRSIGNCVECCGGITCGGCTLPNSWFFTLVKYDSAPIRDGYYCGKVGSASYFPVDSACNTLLGTYILNKTHENYEKTLRYSLKFRSDGNFWEQPFVPYVTTTVRGTVYQSDSFALCDGFTANWVFSKCNDPTPRPGNYETIDCTDSYRFVLFIPTYAESISTNPFTSPGARVKKFLSNENCHALFFLANSTTLDEDAEYGYQFFGSDFLICSPSLDPATGLDIALINWGSRIANAPPPSVGVAWTNELTIIPTCSVADNVPQSIRPIFSSDFRLFLRSSVMFMLPGACRLYGPWDYCRTTDTSADNQIDQRSISLSRGR